MGLSDPGNRQVERIEGRNELPGEQIGVEMNNQMRDE
jgi:hypothetical protein